LDEYDILKIFGNKNRVHMIRRIYAQGGRATHSDLSYRIGLNPKVTRDNLIILIDNGILEKIQIGYRFTKFGVRFGGLLEKTCHTLAFFSDNENNLKRESNTDVK